MLIGGHGYVEDGRSTHRDGSIVGYTCSGPEQVGNGRWHANQS